MTGANSRSRVALLLAAAGLVISAFTIRRGIEVFDDGLTLQAARRVVQGQAPYADFQWAYGPAHVYLLAGLFKLFGVSLMTARVVRTLVDAGVALTVFVLVVRSAPRWLGVVAWLTAACAMAQPPGANPFAPALLLALLAVLAAARGRWLAAAGLCALAAAWRIDFGAYAALAAIAAAAAGGDTRAAGRGRRGVARIAAASGGLGLLLYLPFVIAVGPADAWRDLIGRSLSDGAKWRLPFPLGYGGGLRLWPPGSFAHDAKDVLGFYVPLLLVIGLGLTVVAFVAAGRVAPQPELAGLGVLALGFLAYLMSRTDEFHATPLIVALAALLPLVAMRAPRPAAVGMAVVLAALLAYGASNRLSALFGPPALATIHIDVADGVEAPPAEARSIERMVAAVQTRVPAGRPIYSVTRRSDLVRIDNPLVYVLTGRDNPAREDFALQTSAAAQRKVVALLARTMPTAIVRWTDPISVVREPNTRGRPSGVRLLDEWLAAHYRRDASFGYYDVLVPRA